LFSANQQALMLHLIVLPTWRRSFECELRNADGQQLAACCQFLSVCRGGAMNDCGASSWLVCFPLLFPSFSSSWPLSQRKKQTRRRSERGGQTRQSLLLKLDYRPEAPLHEACCSLACNELKLARAKLLFFTKRDSPSRASSECPAAANAFCTGSCRFARVAIQVAIHFSSWPLS